MPALGSGARRRPSAALLTLIVVLAAAILIPSLYKLSPSVGGRRVRPGVTVAAALASLGGPRQYCGNLLDIRDKVLATGLGNPPVVTLGGVRVPLDRRLGWGDHALVFPGTDRREDAVEVVRQWKTDTGATVMVRYAQGKVSGRKTGYERTVVSAPQPPRVALTFDDGPDPHFTPKVLALLARYKVRATFFVVGVMAKRWSYLVKQEAAQGNEVESHSWSHPYLTQVSHQRLDLEVLRTARIVEQLTGRRPIWLRPPYGAMNARVKAEVRALGERVVFWDVDTNDWRRPPAGTIARRILAGARDGNIILMHDGGGNRSRTVAALAMALPKLLARGVKLVTVSQIRDIVPGPPAKVHVAEAEGEKTYTVTTVEVRVKGAALSPRPLAARAQGHLLLAVKPVLTAFGVPMGWDDKSQEVEVVGACGHAVLRANSRQVNVGGRDLMISAPVLQVNGQLLAPVGLLAKLAGAVLTISADGKTVSFKAVVGAAGPEAAGGQRPEAKGAVGGATKPELIAPPDGLLPK